MNEKNNRPHKMRVIPLPFFQIIMLANRFKISTYISVGLSLLNFDGGVLGRTPTADSRTTSDNVLPANVAGGWDYVVAMDAEDASLRSPRSGIICLFFFSMCNAFQWNIEPEKMDCKAIGRRMLTTLWVLMNI